MAFLLSSSTHGVAAAAVATLAFAAVARAEETATAAAQAQEASQPQPSSAAPVALGASGNLGESTNSADGAQVVGAIEKATKQQPTAKRGHFVIVPIPFRNPLLGAGLTLGAGYLYVPKGATSNARHSVAGIGGMYAEGGSWAVAGGHRGYWSDERYRTTAGLGTGEVFYDLDLTVQGLSEKIPLRQDFEGASVDGAIKVGSHGWLGGGFVYARTEVRLEGPSLPIPEEVRPGQEITLANLKLNGEWDSRDDDLYPRSGYRAEAELTASEAAFGSDANYESLELQFNGYRALGPRQVLAYRVYGKTVGGDPPFFAMAWYGSGGDLRGYTPGTFIGKSLIAAQAEWRWQATTRWGLVAFAGTGTVSDPIGDVDSGQWLPAAGAGVRFKILKALKLNLRADYAWGRDDSTFSLAVGEAF